MINKRQNEELKLSDKIIRRYNTAYIFAISSSNLILIRRIKDVFKKDLGEDCFMIDDNLILKYMSRATLPHDSNIKTVGDIIYEIRRLININRYIDITDNDELNIIVIPNKYIV